MNLRIGVLALARPTFDVPYAQQMAARAFASLDAAGIATLGSRELLFDAAATEAALANLAGERLDLLLVMQVTFTDATMTVRIAGAANAPLAIWAFPEPRAGGRLRLNAFCGLTLAMHALGRAGHTAGWLYAAPDATEAVADLVVLARGGQGATAASLPPGQAPGAADEARAKTVLDALRGARIGLVGEHPAGFDTCRFDPAAIAALAGVSVEAISLPDLFGRARAAPADAVAAAKSEVAATLAGTDGVDQDQLDRSLRVYRALDGLAGEKGLAGFAVRCWPEMFTDYGCAACGPMGMMAGQGVPCACEADVYGALTALLLQGLAGEPSWLVDIVDMDGAGDTGVFWHCGSAPLGMADPMVRPRVQIHSNRRMPLLAEFTLKPGRITVARVSQAHNTPRLVLAGAEVLRAPMSFTGTSGVVRFDRNAGEVAAAMMQEGLEHHVAFAYGEHRPALRAMAARMGLPVVEIA